MIKSVLLLFMIILVNYGCGYKSPPLALESTIPPQINDLTCSVVSGRIVLSWTMPEKVRHGDTVEGFRIYSGYFPKDKFCADCPLKFQKSFDIFPDSSEGFKVDQKKAEFGFGTPLNGQYYIFSIQVIDSKGRFGKRAKPLVIFVENIPAKVSGFSAIQKNGKIVLSWEPFASPEIFYNIYRSNNKNQVNLINHSMKGIDSYSDKDVNYETEYKYKIAACIDLNGKYIEGERSQDLVIYFKDIIPPKKPYGLFAICMKGTIILRWEKVSDIDLAGYNVYRASEKEPACVKLNLKPVVEPYYHDLNVKSGVTYKYSISAVDKAKEPNESKKTEFYKIYCE